MLTQRLLACCLLIVSTVFISAGALWYAWPPDAGGYAKWCLGVCLASALLWAITMSTFRDVHRATWSEFVDQLIHLDTHVRVVTCLLVSVLLHSVTISIWVGLFLIVRWLSENRVMMIGGLALGVCVSWTGVLLILRALRLVCGSIQRNHRV